MSDSPPPPPPPPPGSQPPPPSDPYQAGPQPVGPWPRFAARFIDALVLLIPSFIIGAVIGGTAGPANTAVDAAGWFAGVVTTLIGYGYFVWFESTRGQTVGKIALGYRVVGPDGGNPTAEVSARRNAWMLLSIVPILGGLVQLVIAIVIGVTISSDPFKRGWHDNFAGGTAVVRTR